MVGELGAEVRLFRPGAAGIYRGTVVWRGQPGGRDDAALVHLGDPTWKPPVMRPTVWGRTVTHEPKIPCRTWGLPDFAQHDSSPTETAQPTGVISPGSGLVRNRYILELDAHPPTDLGDSPWAGHSGGAVFSMSSHIGDNPLVGVVALDPAHRSHAALAVVPAYVLLASAGFRAVIEEHVGPHGLRWEPVELQGLMDRQSPLRSVKPAATPASLLLARRAVVPFRPGREELLEELRAWADRPGIGARLVYGKGGQGKTRLAQHFGDQLTVQRWTVLWLDPRTATDQLAVIARVTTPLLVIIDYAETRVTQVQDLFTALATVVGDRPVKILLMARALGEWWPRIARGSEIAADLIDTAPISELPALDQSAKSRMDTYRASVEAFAAALPALDGPSANTDWPRAAERVLAADPLESGSDTTALAVQMRAMIALLDTATDTPPLLVRARSLEDRVLDHERLYWTDIATGYGLVASLGLSTLQDAVAATAVLAPTTVTDLERVLSRIPELADQSLLTRNNVRAWLMNLYPGETPESFAGLAPDRLAEHHVGLLILDHSRPCIIESLIPKLRTDEETRQLLTVCTRAAAHSMLTPAVGHRLTRWCREYSETLLPRAIEVATSVEAPAPLTDALSEIIADTTISTGTLIQLQASLPNVSYVLAPVAADLAAVLTNRYRTNSLSPETDLNSPGF
ncbi:hypothetical protein [Nocardia sp. NPDC058666]|uniref:P-loop NTPase n=1 Tax=Nocardia sp. NPDC058666 TaxID=3346587 RepID=UPI00364669AD